LRAGCTARGPAADTPSVHPISLPTAACRWPLSGICDIVFCTAHFQTFRILDVLSALPGPLAPTFGRQRASPARLPYLVLSRLKACFSIPEAIVPTFGHYGLSAGRHFEIVLFQSKAGHFIPLWRSAWSPLPIREPFLLFLFLTRQPGSRQAGLRGARKSSAPAKADRHELSAAKRTIVAPEGAKYALLPQASA